MKLSRTRITLQDGWVDLDRLEVCRGQQRTTLTASERALLVWLDGHPNQTHSRETLLTEVWGYQPTVRSRTVDTTVQRLRAKIEVDPQVPVLLKTVYGAGYRFEPWAPADDAPLPVGFFGRRREIAALAERLTRGERLVTLTGPGGIGKTALARHRLGSDPSGRFVDLAAARGAWDVLREVARALALPLDPRRDLEATATWIGDALGRADATLLVLDNAEQVSEPLRALLPGWLQRAPVLRLLVTSRAPLGLAAEDVLDLPPLEEGAALALLIDRAALVRPGFSVDGADREAARDLVRRLDGQPLAIELAASRLDLLTIDALRDRLAAALDLLGDDGRPPRHRTLRAVIHSAFDQLDAPTQDALVALGACPGPFPLAAAEALLGPRALDLLQRLLRASMLRREPEAPSGSEPWFRLYVGVRAFAEERLAAHPDRDAALARHRAWLVARAEAGRAGVERRGDPRSVADLGRLAPDLIALATRDEATHPAVVARALLTLDMLFVGAIPTGDAPALVEVAVRAARAAQQPHLEADALRMRAVLASIRGLFPAAHRDLDRAAALASDAPPALRCRVALARGVVCGRQGHAEAAEPALGEALAAAREAEIPMFEARALHGLGVTRRQQGALLAAEGHYLQALRLFRAAGDGWFALATHGSLANVYLDLGRVAEAEACHDAALDAAREVGDRTHEAVLLNNIGTRLLSQRRLDDAEAAWATALRLHDALGSLRGRAYALGGLGAVDALRGRVPEALDRLAAAAHAHRAAGNLPAEAQTLAELARVHHQVGDLAAAEAAFERALTVLDQVPAPLHRWRIDAGRAALAAERGDAPAFTACCDAARLGAARVDDPLAPSILGALAIYAAWLDAPASVAEALAAADPRADVPAGADWPIVEALVRRLTSLAVA